MKQTNKPIRSPAAGYRGRRNYGPPVGSQGCQRFSLNVRIFLLLRAYTYIHAVFGHTDSESAQHFLDSEKLQTNKNCAPDGIGFEPLVMESIGSRPIGPPRPPMYPFSAALSGYSHGWRHAVRVPSRLSPSFPVSGRGIHYFRDAQIYRVTGLTLAVRWSLPRPAKRFVLIALSADSANRFGAVREIASFVKVDSFHLPRP